MSEAWEQWEKKFADIGYRLNKTAFGKVPGFGIFCRFLARSVKGNKTNKQIAVRDFEDSNPAIRETKLGELYAQC